MSDAKHELQLENKQLRRQLEDCIAANKELSSPLGTNQSNGLSNDELHQFNNTAALLDANLELALDALLKLPHNKKPLKQTDISNVENFIIAAQTAKTELVDIVNP